jgi:hypothetical protein
MCRAPGAHARADGLRGAHLYVLCDPRDRTVVRLLFGHAEEDG